MRALPSSRRGSAQRSFIERMQNAHLFEKERRDGRPMDEIKRRIKSSMTNEIPDKLFLMIPGYARHTRTPK